MFSKKISLLPVSLQKNIYRLAYLFIGMFFYHFKSHRKKDIFVFSTRRGGSTLLGQILSANKGIRNIDQPLTSYAPRGIGGLLRQDVTTKYLDHSQLSQYPSINYSHETKIKEYISGLLDGKIMLSPWLEYKASNKKLNLYTDRVMLKFTGANSIIQWFSDNYDAHIIYLSRHPIPNALSIVNNNWTITASAYLENCEFCKNYLTNEQESYAAHVIINGDYFECALLNWCLENIVPLNYLPTNAIFLTYEEIVLLPLEIIEFISDRLNLENKSGMYAVSQTPSFSTVLSESNTVKNINNKSNALDKYNNILNRWTSMVSQEQIVLTQKMLDVFKIDIYSAENSIPNTKYLNYPDLFIDRVMQGSK